MNTKEIMKQLEKFLIEDGWTLEKVIDSKRVFKESVIFHKDDRRKIIKVSSIKDQDISIQFNNLEHRLLDFDKTLLDLIGGLMSFK